MNRIFLSYFSGFEDPRKLFNGRNLTSEEFSKAVSSLKSGVLWKTTHAHRHQSSDHAIRNLAMMIPNCSILDVGASDGSTSLSLIEKLGEHFSKYYVSDVSFHIRVIEKKGIAYFYDVSSRECFLSVSKKLILYNVSSNPLSPATWYAKYRFSKAPEFVKEKSRIINLIQPGLLKRCRTDCRLKLVEWNMFGPWHHDKVDIIKVANILNPVYFENHQIIQALLNFHFILSRRGKLILIDNRKEEQWSIFRKTKNGFALEQNGGGGTDIGDLVRTAVLIADFPTSSCENPNEEESI